MKTAAKKELSREWGISGSANFAHVKRHMAENLREGEKHPNIRNLLNDLAALGEKMKAAGKSKEQETGSPHCPRCDFKLD